jgi:hypothetical protein
MLSMSLLLCVSIAAAAVLEWKRRPSGAWRWRSVTVNGWQSFSYAGVVSVGYCWGWVGLFWRAMWAVGLWWFNPRVQTAWMFSGAFHDGGSVTAGLFMHTYKHIYIYIYIYTTA